MSHKTEIKTSLNNGHYLKKALEALGIKYKEGKNLKTKGHYGVHESVDVLLEGNDKAKWDGAIGFKKNENGTYTAVGDFYALKMDDGRNVTPEMLKCEVQCHSKEQEVNDRLFAAGFVVDASMRKENKEYIEITYERTV